MNVYTVEIDGVQYDIEGDRPPTEAEARAAVSAHTGSGRHPDAPPPMQLHESARQPAHTPERGAVRRFLEPVGEAAQGMAAMPAALVRAATQPSGAGLDLVRGIYEGQVGQGQQAVEAFNRGDYQEGIGRTTFAALPLVGPAAADIGDTAREGNVAGALGKAAVLAAPIRVPKLPGRLAKIIEGQARARMIKNVLRPRTEAQAAVAQDIALDLARGVPGRQMEGGIGAGRLDELLKRVKARKIVAKDELNAFQSNKARVNTDRIEQGLRGEAMSKETIAPSGQVFTEEPELVNALTAQANWVREITAAHGGDVPAGVLFRQRAGLNRKFNKARQRQGVPGEIPAAEAEAGTTRASLTSETLHNAIPDSAITDRAYRVNRQAEIMLERSGLRDVIGSGWDGVKTLLAGRLAGVMLGGGIGLTSGNLAVGALGALTGGVLSESKFWGSLRAQKYVGIADALRAGDVDKAATLIARAANAYAVSEAVRDRERNRKAQSALRTQAEGVVSP